jgi:hypothetical protein
MTIEQFINIVFVQSALSAVVAIVCFYRYKERGIVIRLIGYAFLIGSICNMSPFAFVHLGLNRYNNISSIIFIIFYFTLVTLLYRSQFKNKGIHWMIFIVVFILIVIVNSIFFQKTSINSFSYIVLSITILVYTIAFFYKLMAELPAQHIHHLPMFWVNSAFLFYHAGSFFLFAFTAYIVTVLKNDLMIYWTFHNALNIIEHLIILIGVYYDLRSLPPRDTRMGNRSPAP